MDKCKNCGEPIAHDGYDWYHDDDHNFDSECITTRNTTWNPDRDYAEPA